MSLLLEDYALIGDTHTAALVSREGSIDWLCLPRFDSGACFGALLGDRRHGHWSLRPCGTGWRAERRYRGESLVLETTFSRDGDVVRVVDCMPPRGDHPELVRRVEGVSGQVRMTGELAPRHDYGHIVPWIRAAAGRWSLLAGADRLAFDADPPSVLSDADTVRSDFTVRAGESASFRLCWHSGPTPPEPDRNTGALVADTEQWWSDWAARCAYDGPYRDAVVRSLLTLKALTYAPTGGIVAAPTTSLPELLGGGRNWDYRYCWLRDATFTLVALLDAGYEQEACEWREWLVRAIAGKPGQMQILYGVDGGRRLPELELDWLPGYAGSRPVRVGNAAAGQ